MNPDTMENMVKKHNKVSGKLYHTMTLFTVTKEHKTSVHTTYASVLWQSDATQ